MNTVNIYFEGIDAFRLDTMRLNSWITAVAQRYSKSVGPITYVFCNDAYILEVNQRYLQHDYFTDIITFDYGNARRIAGDMVISLDTVRTNAEALGVTIDDELRRVIIHGVLHLCGINDKGPGEREIMEAHENEALRICPDKLLEI